MADITYLEDLTKELAKEHGLSEEEAYEICKLNIDHVYQLVKDPNVVSIRFPMLGVLCFNLKKGKYSRPFREYKTLIGKKVSKVEEMYEEHKDLAHARNSYFSIIRKYFFPKLEDRIKAKQQKVFEKIENKQNG